jgi:uncharacterized protein DUF4394/Calx-beta domain-containing protein
MRRVGLGVLMAGAALATAAPASAEPAVGVIASAGNALVSFDTTNPGAYTGVRAITGLQPNERIVGLDYRYFPLGNGAKALYAVGVVDGGATDAARVYTIDPGTGAATQVGTTPVTLTGGDVYGVDFNHTVDRIRVVNDGDENARLNPDTGARADAPTNDTDLDPSGQHLRAIAYDRVDNDPATPTTLYGISRNQRALVTIGGLNSTPSPNLGGVNMVGLLGVTPGDTAMDISPSGTAFASLDDRLYTLNLGSGAASGIGALPTSLRGLAVVPSASVQFDVTTLTAAENGGPVTVGVTRSGSTASTARVTYAASDGSAVGTLTFGPGETSKTITVPVTDDAYDLPDRTVQLSLSASDALVKLGAQATATLTITDDDDPRTTPGSDTVEPRTVVTAPRSISLNELTRRGVKVTARPNEAARLKFTLERSGSVVASKSLGLAAGRRSVTLKPSQRQLAARRSLSLRLKVVATDAAGNRSTVTRTINVTR